MRQVRVLSFEAADEQGNKYPLEVWQSIAEYKSRRPCETMRGLKTLWTADQLEVKYRAKGEYELDGIILRSSDPKAP